MVDLLLQMKLYTPPIRPSQIPRPHLIQKLRRGSRIILISAPAGSGKTTLLSQFTAQLQQPIAWLSLDEADDNLHRFWRYLIHACQSALSGIGESALPLLDKSQQLPSDTIPTILINDLINHDQPMVLVLDDFHTIRTRTIHESMMVLLDYLPQNLNIIISTRIDPPWPLARYRARNQLVEIRSRDLRFSTEETAVFLNKMMDLALSTEDTAALTTRTEGWAAGLQLVAIAMQSLPAGNNLSEFVQSFTGSHLYIAEYLIEEVLQRQTEEVQAFLLQTSILERLNAELCNAITENENGQAILNTLHRENLFVIPLDAEGQWFRYHHLFADLLQARLPQTLSTEAITALHIRASAWYEQNGFVNEAIHHALAVQNFNRVGSLVDQADQTMIMTGHHLVLKNWLKALPSAYFQSHPRLEIYRVLIDLSQGTLDMSEQTLLEKEKLIRTLPPSPVNDQLRIEAMVFLCLFLAHQNTSRTIQITQELLGELPEDNLRLRAFLYSALYRAYGMEGDIEKSAPAYRECLRLAHGTDEYGMVSITTMVRAFDLCQYGRLDEAVQYCQEIIDTDNQTLQNLYFPAGPSNIGLAGIFLERNDLDLASEYLEKGIELCRRGGSDGLYTGYIQKARLQQARGDLKGALAEIQRLEQAFQRWDFTVIARHISILLAMDDIDGASRLEAPLLTILDDSPYAKQLPLIAAEAFKLCLARIYLANGAIEQTNQILDEIQATAEPDGRFGRMLEVELLRALAEQKREGGSITLKALNHFEKALKLGELAGFALLFLEEGLPLVPLLNDFVKQRTAPKSLKTYAKKLLNAFAGNGEKVTSLPLVEVVDLVEQLTLRELEVLQRIAAGDSNQAIAEKLVITERTVKKHASNIYSKLNVNNRTQAIARARQLGLLSADS